MNRALRVALTLTTLLVFSISAAPRAAGAGNVYNVFKCHEWATGADELQEAGSHSSYERIEQCRPQSTDLMFGITNTGAASHNAYEQYMYSAPPSTRIVRACFQHRLRRQNHHRAEVFAYPGFAPIVFGGDQPSGWSPTQCFDLNHQQLIVRLSCSNTGDCPAAPNAHAYLRNLVLFMADGADPTVDNAEGSLLSGGWIRGSASLALQGSDSGSGTYQLAAYVNGTNVSLVTNSCRTGGLGWPSAISLIPCSQPIPPLRATLDTASAPFRNGENTLSAYVADFTGNFREAQYSVLVDNVVPNLAFVRPLDPEDPELIRASVSDAHSGIAAASIYFRRVGTDLWMPTETDLNGSQAHARIDSAGVEPGEYEFRVEARDAAGNLHETVLAEDGLPMRLHFPLKQRARLAARVGAGNEAGQLVPYGTASKVRGRLIDDDGDPLAGAELLVSERFGAGALIRRRPTTVVTDARGRFESKIPAGPSREVEVSYSGSPRFLSAERSAGSFLVRSKASFETSRDVLPEGERVAFEGRVRHFGARVPKGGKLIELQVRIGKHRWDTVREAFRTDSTGRFRLGYRFGQHYETDARFTFRVKIQEEGDWPFERSTSAHREVTVKAR